jgi:Na+/melibiose symporter-like transporter
MSAAIAILIAASIFFILYTPVYASVTPKIGSWPFFYVYMLVYMPATSLVLWIATRLQDRLSRRNTPPQEQGTAGAGSGAT